MLIGVGENNKFGHPNIEILERIKSIGAKIYRTDKMGEIELIVNKKGEMKVKTKIKSIEENISINELIKNAISAYLKTN